jgi:hypothetical protein
MTEVKIILGTIVMPVILGSRSRTPLVSDFGLVQSIVYCIGGHV